MTKTAEEFEAEGDRLSAALMTKMDALIAKHMTGFEAFAKELDESDISQEFKVAIATKMMRAIYEYTKKDDG